MMRFLVIALLALLPSAVQGQETLILPTRPGVTEALSATFQPNAPATLILFPGGSGVVASVKNNFLLRIVPDLLRLKFSVIVVDAPSDQTGGMLWTFRASTEHAQDIRAIVTLAKSRSPAPVWLIGTSRGSVSAANGAATLGRQIAGVVLTSSVWARGMAGIPLESIQVPALIVHNRDDGCQESPFSGTSIGMTRLVSPHELLAVTGGIARGDACGAMSPHGYLGIESSVITPMTDWIKAH